MELLTIEATTWGKDTRALVCLLGAFGEKRWNAGCNAARLCFLKAFGVSLEEEEEGTQANLEEILPSEEAKQVVAPPIVRPSISPRSF